jgi:hypothetical protein
MKGLIFPTENSWKQTVHRQKSIESQGTSIITTFWQNTGLRDLLSDKDVLDKLSKLLET